MLDRLSGGRLGFGAGSARSLMGLESVISIDESREHFRGALDVITQAGTEEPDRMRWTMQIGINIANHKDLLSTPYIQTTARMAEDLGFDSVWIPDHIVVPRAVEERYGPVYYDAIAVLAYLAGITSRVRLGTTVLVVPYRHPVVLAKQVASIDQLSHGRVILGIGVGWAEAEFALLQLAFAERGPRTDEALHLMHALWTQDAPRFEGTYYTVSDLRFQPKPMQQPMPIWVGGNSRAALRRTAEFATGWHPIDTPPDRLQHDLQTLHALCHSKGRTPPALCPRFTVRVQEHAADSTRRFMAGDTEQILADLLQLETLGASHVVLSTQTNDMSRFCWEIETLAREVVPRLL
jgi:probable F420-dependent oxidoreductase